jgi:hypothetical protein
MNRRLAMLAAVIILALTLLAPAARAQYAAGLPPGILNVEVDGQPIDAVTSPVTANATPELTGRVELGVPVIELAIADGEVIRFPAELNQNGRFRVTTPQPLADGLYTLYISDVLIGSFSVSGAAEAEQPRSGRLLDIARIVPYPTDAGDAFPGLGFLDGRFYTLDEEAVRTAGTADGASAAEVRQTRQALADAGWIQRYESRLAAPSTDNPNTFSVQFSSFVVEYASGADARSAFAALTGAETGAEFPVIGDESILALLSGTTPDTGAAYQAARLIYRTGPLLGMIVYADLLNQPPDLALLETIGRTVVDRAAVVLDEQTVALGSMVLRIDPKNATGSLIRRDLYDVRAGTLTALYGEDEATRANRVALFTGTTDAFTATTNGTFATGGGQTPAEEVAPAEAALPTPTSVFIIEGQETAPEATPAAATIEADAAASEAATAQVFIVNALYAFPGENEADAWLFAQRDQLLASAQPGQGAFTEVADAPVFGQSSATFATRRAVGVGEQTAIGFRIYTRVGPIVAVLDVDSIPSLPFAAAASLVEAQIACIEAGACDALTPLPDSLFAVAGAPEGRAVAEPAAVDVAAPTATPASVIIVEGQESAPSEGTAPTPTPASVIVVEGEGTGAEAPEEPGQNRERRRDRQATRAAGG